MRFWAREVIGWMLVFLGLVVFFFAFLFLIQHYLVEGAPLTLIGVIIFRGGIHLLKVAVAARVALRAEEKVTATPTGLAVGTRPAARPVTGRR